ncbi:interferon-induced 35 kDa protein homolog isoform X2 [Pseudorasbora parva]|uniref:interferon-induced 35 kDa protein homolog isoform X2 n=1 Tax=Pseudorasbora parva TaxID=51549 RepID=UPI00351EB561
MSEICHERRFTIGRSCSCDACDDTGADQQFKSLTQTRRNCGIKSLFLFCFCALKYSRGFITLRLNHWSHMNYINKVFTSFLDLIKSLSMRISTAVPERRVVFEGKTKDGAHAVSFDVDSRIVYPMEGGTAMITFEEKDVAQKILTQKEHKVELGDCDHRITLQAKPIQFLVPEHVEMETLVCPHRILVSNLPKEEAEDKVLDKLNIHFSRKRDGGGEVEDVDMLHDSGTVVITFVDDDIAKHLSDKQDHEVDFGKKKYKVKVTPFLNGEIAQMKMCNSECMRTVLLTGIPDIMVKDNLQDNLEIHFQKTTNGGGEVESILYNPLGHIILALFEEDCPKDSQTV